MGGDEEGEGVGGGFGCLSGSFDQILIECYLFEIPATLERLVWLFRKKLCEILF